MFQIYIPHRIAKHLKTNRHDNDIDLKEPHVHQLNLLQTYNLSLFQIDWPRYIPKLVLVN